jgi:AGZA family xanthine/uracil permease-like MFS transporter
MLETFFRLSENETSVRTEILAGVTTFLTMSYIIFVQPAVLSGAMFGAPTGMDFGAVTAATCIAAALATALMGLYARYPIAQAPGMGQNFFFVFSVIPAAAAVGHPEPWKAALGVIFVSGVLFLALSLSGAREHLIDALSPSMKSALGAGIGVFIAFIGLQNAEVILKDPGTAVRLNPAFVSPDMVIFFAALVLSLILTVRRVPGALLYGMATALALALAGRALLPASAIAGSQLATRFTPATAIVALPPSPGPTFFAFDAMAALTPALLPLVILVLFMDLFDTLGTLVAVTQEAGLLRDGRLPRANRAMVSDAVGTVAGAALGTSTVTSYIESAAGVEQGGRTGLVSVVVAILFLVALPFAPLIAMVGSYAPITAPALVIVGGLMIRAVARIEWQDPTEAFPAFFTIVGIPLTYSIADGLALGLVLYPIVKAAAGRQRELGWLQVALAVILVGYFVFLRSQLA